MKLVIGLVSSHLLVSHSLFFPSRYVTTYCSLELQTLNLNLKFVSITFILHVFFDDHINKPPALSFSMLDKIKGREEFVALSFIIRIIQGLGEAGYITAAFSLIAKEFPDCIATTFVRTKIIEIRG